MNLCITALLQEYRAGRRTVREVISHVLQAIRDDDAHRAWIAVVDDAWLEPYLRRLDRSDPSRLPLYGIPFAIKDNIDLAGVPTTAACPDFAYVPQEHAFVVARLIEAGAVPVGKTNLDQFATGLVGVRSPYGPCRNPFDPEYVSGGSSSGSAVAVSLGQVSFSLGTDTAGSGRVPAAFTNIVGVKPTCGLLSTHGVVPACRSLDSVSIFAGTAADAQAVLAVAAGFDEQDPYSRADRVPELGHAAIPADAFVFGVPQPEQLRFFGNDDAQRLFAEGVERLQSLGGTAVEVDLEPILEAARLLYEGPWIAERYAAVGEFIAAHPHAALDVTRETILQGARKSAAELFAGVYRLEELRRASDAVWSLVDFVVTPTAGTIYRIAEVQNEPFALNSNLGYYTNFMNLLDFSALAVPVGFQRNGLPFGVTLFAPAFYDQDLLAVGDRLQRAAALPLGATGRALPEQAPVVAQHGHTVEIAVCGAHMSGLPLNGQLTSRNARLLQRTSTAPEYRFYALPGGPPHRPGLVRVAQGGQSIELEVWGVPADRVGSFLAGIPAPLCLGRVRLVDGREVTGFLCEAAAVSGADDITELRSWRRYLPS